MKAKTIVACLLMCCASAWGKNETVKVQQVTESVSLTDDVDYVITSASPFGTMGSVNIENTEHAVLIIQGIRPSKVIESLLGHVFINGEQAVSGINCQVRMFNRGSIIFPYAKDMKPLTCYTDADYAGTACNNYTEGSSGGFMKTLSKTLLDNSIRSFKLKRGYMVTFATGQGGWGYSRCFIADMEDLEIANVPAPLYGKISSYRLFQWYNASKAGIHDTSAEANAALGTTSCFDWGQGNASLLPDVEWVSHHIYEDWPSPATCGGVSQTCHMKTNNEPGNSADDHPQDVQTVLNNWQNLMRTGLRLCSESSHDGSMNHLKTFIEEIDKRGWRCDILDLHCYWDGQWNNLDWYIQEYGKGRPCWISEWVWGASWSNNGAFADGRRNDDATYNGTKPILDRLNSNSKVERYFYWNSEQGFTRVWRDGRLTRLGEYFAKMDVPLAYNPANEYVPRIVYNAPGELQGTFTKKTGALTLKWTDINGDMIDSISVEYKAPNSNVWQKVANIDVKDMTTKPEVEYTYATTLEGDGLHSFRVQEYYTSGTTRRSMTTNEYSATLAASSSVGALQYGQLKIGDADYVTTDLTPTEEPPYVVMGPVSNANTGNGITSQIKSVSKNSFTYRLYPWALPSPVDISKPETVDYLVLPADTIYHLPGDMMLISAKTPNNIKGDVVSITFPEPFPEGITPVVVAQQSTTVASYAPVTVRVSNVSNTGFDVQLVRQEGVSGIFNGQKVVYFACTPGQASIGGGKLLSAGINTKPVGGASRISIDFLDADQQTMALSNAIVIAAPQTNNLAIANIIRQHALNTNDEGLVIGASYKRQVDTSTTSNESNSASKNGDYMGYIIVSDDPNGSATDTPVITGIHSTMDSQHGTAIYNAAGQRISSSKPIATPGVYIISNGRYSKKILVK